ncbi:MAG: 4-(cytidine 5'-diphospho)-2-C-methyl-D-erythritol kinase [Myxococcales bacterium]|jgi:4-diphosphocytidyl-2-C-methyl-D-erythritol kinase|nr:4-(cytidine 5'-diphospho)-2-C-methyl-D-erythritol kinase [Myxococcales bacterium]
MRRPRYSYGQLVLTTITRTTPAKVNLCLRIVGRRSDGYHLLDSIFAAIDLSDRLTISAARTRDATDVEVACDHPQVPADETNLAARAARALLERCEVAARVRITIEKHVPPGAGLGGGSSNAATVLTALRDMLSLNIGPGELAELALSLGADVPFFLTGGCARVRGIGERVDPIAGWPNRELVVALPPVAVSTAWAFHHYRGGYASDPVEPARMAAGERLDPALMRNDLESVVLAAYPEVAIAKSGLLAAGAAATVMSGSGAAVLGLSPPGSSARVIRDAFAAAHPSMAVHSCRILTASGSPIGSPIG